MMKLAPMVTGLRHYIFLTSLFISPIIWANSSPVPMLENSATQIINTLKNNQTELKTHRQVVYQAIERYLLPHVDLSGMSRSVLGRQAWSRATTAEKAEFSSAFTRLVIRTYANPLAEYSGETVHFSPLHAENNSRFVRVNSIISRPNGQKIPLTYSMVLINGQWKIYDLSVEGVSLLQSFRSQFAAVIQRSNMKTLITEMNHKKEAV